MPFGCCLIPNDIKGYFLCKERFEIICSSHSLLCNWFSAYYCPQHFIVFFNRIVSSITTDMIQLTVFLQCCGCIKHVGKKILEGRKAYCLTEGRKVKTIIQQVARRLVSPLRHRKRSFFFLDGSSLSRC